MVHFVSIETQQEARLEWISGGVRSLQTRQQVGDSVCLVCEENGGGEEKVKACFAPVSEAWHNDPHCQ